MNPKLIARDPFTDAAFEDFAQAVSDQLNMMLIQGTVFTTDRTDRGVSLFSEYILEIGQAAQAHKLSREEMQFQINYHFCNCCDAFISQVGHLVAVKEPVGGRSKAPKITTIWDKASKLSLNPYARVAKGLAEKVKEQIALSGVAYNLTEVIGQPHAGGYGHLHAKLDAHAMQMVAARQKQVLPAELMLLQSHKDKLWVNKDNLIRASSMLESGLIKADMGQLSGQLKRYRGYHTALERLHNSLLRTALMYETLVSTPYISHMTNTVLGQLLERLNNDTPLDDVTLIASINRLLAPEVYQRPQAPPAEQNVLRAAALVKELNLERAFERRQARLADIEEWRWRPRQPADADSNGPDLGIFSGVKTKAKKPMVNPAWDQITKLHTAGKITLSRLMDLMVQNEAVGLKVYVDHVNRDYVQLTAPTHADAPELFSHGRVGWYRRLHGSPPSHFNLPANEWIRSLGVITSPAQWRGTKTDRDELIILLEGARDLHGKTLSLFPELLRSDLREVRSTIEAYSATGNVTVGDDGLAGVGVTNNDGHPVLVAVLYGDGTVAQHNIDRLR